MKTAVVLDSNSGLSQAQGREAGFFILPMPFSIDGKEYLDGVNLSPEDFVRYQREGADIVTSQPAPGDIMAFWDDILKTYDSIIHLPMSSALSGSCQTANMLSQEEPYLGRVFVVDNKRISITQISAGQDAKQLVEAGLLGEEIKSRLEKAAGEASIYLTVQDLKYLKKGGRITPMAAALGTLLKIKPVLQIGEKKIDAFAKARTLKQAKSIMVEAVQEDLKGRLSDPEGKNCRIMVAQYEAEEEAALFAKELEGVFPGCPHISVVGLSLSVATHIGPGTIAIAAARRIAL